MVSPQDVFVRAESAELKPLGIAKLEDLSKTWAQISYFDGPKNPLKTYEVDPAIIKSVRVSAHRRAYWEGSNGIWRVGRVLDHLDEQLLIRFPNGRDLRIDAREVFIRWNRPIVDPTPYLARQLNETPIFSDARSGFVAAMVSQRAACQGMGGLISSLIEMEPHQIEVVRRVLQDPVQRYLLADEVGLGKTIEAGILIRQYVLDDPEDHRVVILVPPALVNQWKDEMRRRFLLGHQLDRSVLVLATDKRAEITAALAQPGMVVIDEAHHLNRDNDLYELVREKTSDLSRFLLLSATPVLGNEKGFLEMLHLLDPVVFPVKGVAQFRRKIEHRQALAEALAGLVPENVLQLDDYLDSLSGRFGEDEILKDLVVCGLISATN